MKSPQEPPVHDIMCLPEQQALVESAAPPRSRSLELKHSAQIISDEEKREPRLTFIARSPSQQPFVSGALVSKCCV